MHYLPLYAGPIFATALYSTHYLLPYTAPIIYCFMQHPILAVLWSTKFYCLIQYPLFTALCSTDYCLSDIMLRQTHKLYVSGSLLVTIQKIKWFKSSVNIWYIKNGCGQYFRGGFYILVQLYHFMSKKYTSLMKMIWFWNVMEMCSNCVSECYFMDNNHVDGRHELVYLHNNYGTAILCNENYFHIYVKWNYWGALL